MKISNTAGFDINSALNSKIQDRQNIATKLEASFISEMLKSIGMEARSGEFNGGLGEQQFQSFLREQQAKLIAEKGGLGLASHFSNSIMDHNNESI